jgi:PAS domain S-box-containing protein
MAHEAPKHLPEALYTRGRLITPLARWLSVAFAFVALGAFWNSPQTRPWPALAVTVAYLVWNVLSQFWLQKRWRGSRAVKVAHDAADSLALSVGAALSGGLSSPVWLLYYPHVVGVSVRGGLRYALTFGAIAALAVTALAIQSEQPLGVLNALALLFCAFMGGATSSYLQKVQARLEQVNADLKAANAQLSETVEAQAASQQDQAEALDQLRESEERYRRLLGRIQDGVVIIQEGRLAYANEVMGGILGADPAELVGVDFREVIDPEDRRDVGERYRAWEQSEAVAGGLEARIRSRQGDLKRVHVRAGSLLFEGKRSVIATVRDVTRERQMEREIKDHAERLAAINEIAAAVNQSLTIEDIFSVAAQEARRIVPFDRLSIALTSGDAADAAIELVAVGRGSRRERAPFGARDVAWAFERPTAWCEGDGEAPPFATALFRASPTRALATVPLRSPDRVIGALSLGRSRAEPFSTLDLAVLEPMARHVATALDNARLLEAVRRRNREFESLLEIGRGVLERADLGTLLPLVTRSVNRVMGTRYCLLMLRHGDELRLAAHEGLEPEVEQQWQVLKIGESLTGRVVQEGAVLAVTEMRDDPRLMARERVERYGYRSFLGVPLRRGGEVLGSLEVITKERRVFSAEDQHLMAAFADQAAIAIDNARLLEETRAHLGRIVEANERLEGLDQMRREYLRNVSHEFRTPLTVVRGYSEFLLEDPAQSAQADVLRVMVESCDRVIDLVDTLMDVSRIEQGEAEGVLQVQDLDLREVASASVEMLRAAANKKKVRVELDLPGDGYSLQGDRSLIHQVVRKLVDNAVKYSEAGGRVVVRGRAHEREVTLEVEDGGIGIAPEHLQRIFEKFYMVDGGISRRVGGTGVGLYLVREIVRLHQGRVEVDSRPGQGSTFAVRLPRVQHGAPLRRAVWA